MSVTSASMLVCVSVYACVQTSSRGYQSCVQSSFHPGANQWHLPGIHQRGLQRQGHDSTLTSV